MSSGWFTAIPLVGKLFTESRDLIDQAVPDGDMRVKLIGNLEEIQRQADYELRIRELETKTVPWVDALHKMGRQIQWYCTAGVVVLSMCVGHELTQYEALLLGGVSISYQLIKGKGR